MAKNEPSYPLVTEYDPCGTEFQALLDRAYHVDRTPPVPGVKAIVRDGSTVRDYAMRAAGLAEANPRGAENESEDYE